MTTYFLTIDTSKKAIELVKTIIKSEDLEASVHIQKDGYESVHTAVDCEDWETYDTIKQIYRMVTGRNW